MSDKKPMKVTKQETVMFSKGPCCFVLFECAGTSDRAMLQEDDAIALVAAWNTRAPDPAAEGLAKALESFKREGTPYPELHRHQMVIAIKERIAALTQEKDKAFAANELDRRRLHKIVTAFEAEITGRMWLLEGRGSYEWDDDKYRQEFGWAVHAIQEKLELLRRISSSLKDCPADEKGVDKVRRLEGLEQENVQLLASHERLREALQRYRRRDDCKCGTCMNADAALREAEKLEGVWTHMRLINARRPESADDKAEA